MGKPYFEVVRVKARCISRVGNIKPVEYTPSEKEAEEIVPLLNQSSEAIVREMRDFVKSVEENENEDITPSVIIRKQKVCVPEI